MAFARCRIASSNQGHNQAIRRLCGGHAAATARGKPFSIRYSNDDPRRQVGLAGSSAIITATLRALRRCCGRSRSRSWRSRQSSSAVEREDLHIGAGLQDRVILPPLRAWSTWISARIARQLIDGYQLIRAAESGAAAARVYRASRRARRRDQPRCSTTTSASSSIAVTASCRRCSGSPISRRVGATRSSLAIWTNWTGWRT